MLAQKDLTLIENLLDKKLDEKIKHLPSKDDFYTTTTKLFKEIKDQREEVTVVTSYKDQIEDHETRILKLEEVLEPQKN
jgi:vacuolar-type H+-ATPase subunit E/Vma4